MSKSESTSWGIYPADCKTLELEGNLWECLTFGSCPYAHYAETRKYCNHPDAGRFEEAERSS
jgi:hypothetical protein